MPILPKRLPSISRNEEKSQDAYYYLSSKIQKAYFGLSFHERANSWKPAAGKVYARSRYLPGGALRNLKPDPKKVRGARFIDAVLAREVARSFSGKAIPFTALSNLLAYACGEKAQPAKSAKTPKAPKAAKALSPRGRVFPSAGARYSLEFYVLSLDVAGLSPGLYHFDPERNGLALMREDSEVFRFKKFWAQAQQFKGASAVIYVTSIFEKCREKYGPRALRYVLLEAGGVGLQMNLLCELMGLGFNYDGGGYESEIEKILGVDGVEEGLVTTFVIGKKSA